MNSVSYLELHDLKDRVAEVLRLDPTNYTTSREFFARNKYFFLPIPRTPFQPFEEGDPANDILDEHLAIINEEIANASSDMWKFPAIGDLLNNIAKEISKTVDKNKNSNLFTQAHDPENPKAMGSALNRYLRWAALGLYSGPPVHRSLMILGRHQTLQRLQQARQWVAEQQAEKLAQPKVMTA